MEVAVRTLIVISLALAACAEDVECPTGERTSGDGAIGCNGGRAFAARDSDGLFPTQAEVDRYVDRCRRAWRSARNTRPLPIP